MIWCTVSGHGILGLHFVEDDAQNPLTVKQERYREDDAQNPLTVKQERYREIIIVPFVQDLEHFCRARNVLLRQWMQQDGATAHMEGKLLACLQQHFGDRLISRGAEFPSLHTPHMAYIWGMLKASILCSEDPPGNVPELREKIQAIFVSLQQLVFVSMSNNLKNHYEQCVRREGIHFEHILYRHI